MATNSIIFSTRSGQVELISSGGLPYQISVEDDGSLSTEINANVPSAPTNLSIIPGNGQLSVSWSSPNNLSRLPIVNYILEYSTSASGSYTTHSTNITTSRDITGLSGGLEYFVRVRAVNVVGGGSYATGTGVLNFSIGDTGPGGGIVFYDAGSQQSWGRYLEAAPSTWNGGSDPTRAWSNSTSSVSTQRGIGFGAQNTANIIAVSSTAPAPTTAVAYQGGGLSDWFLPSQDELYQLYLQKDVVGGFAAAYYYSSSFSSPFYGMLLRMSDGHENFSYVTNQYRIRPVRYI